MKVIDLLNKIANGDIPKNIRFNDMFMTYDEKKQNYFSKFGNEIDWKYTVMEYINDEIEIIEDNDDLELIPDDELYLGCDILHYDSECMDYNFRVLKDKINELAKDINEIRKQK